MVKFLLLFRLLGVTGGGRRDESGVKELEDFVADVGELRLDPGQKAPLKWVAIRVKSGLRRRSRESGVKKRRRSGLRSGSSALRSGFSVRVFFFFFLVTDGLRKRWILL